MAGTSETPNPEETSLFQPRYDSNGLIPVITIDAADGRVLMLAYMNDAALEKTLATRQMHYWSRSRQALWHKGATSGHFQQLEALRTDCDQDALLATVRQTGAACHTGRRSCFYRSIAPANCEANERSAIKLQCDDPKQKPVPGQGQA